MYKLFTKYFFLICFLVISIVPLQLALNQLGNFDFKTNFGQYSGYNIHEMNNLEQANFGFNEKTKLIEVKKEYFDQIKTKELSTFKFSENILVTSNQENQSDLSIETLFTNSDDSMTIYNKYYHDLESDYPEKYNSVAMPYGITGIQVVEQIKEHPLNIKRETRSLFKNQHVFLDTATSSAGDEINGFYVFNTYNQTKVLTWKCIAFINNFFENQGLLLLGNTLIIILCVFVTWYLAKNPFQGEKRFLELIFIFLLVNILTLMATNYFILMKSYVSWINILFIPMYLRILLRKQDY